MLTEIGRITVRVNVTVMFCGAITLAVIVIAILNTAKMPYS